jgi:hypothetical protein
MPKPGLVTLVISMMFFIVVVAAKSEKNLPVDDSNVLTTTTIWGSCEAVLTKAIQPSIILVKWSLPLVVLILAFALITVLFGCGLLVFRNAVHFAGFEDTWQMALKSAKGLVLQN